MDLSRDGELFGEQQDARLCLVIESDMFSRGFQPPVGSDAQPARLLERPSRLVQNPLQGVVEDDQSRLLQRFQPGMDSGASSAGNGQRQQRGGREQWGKRRWGEVEGEVGRGEEGA